jgi:cytochrome c553
MRRSKAKLPQSKLPLNSNLGVRRSIVALDSFDSGKNEGMESDNASSHSKELQEPQPTAIIGVGCASFLRLIISELVDMRLVRLCAALVLFSTSAFGADPEPASAPKSSEKAEKLTAKGVDFFESKIRPVLTQRCYSCHASQAKEVKGSLLLDTRDALRKGGESGAAVVPGNVEESLLIQAIKHETYEMPPGDKLPDNVIADFEEWVRMGAPDPRIGKAAGAKKLNLAEARSFWSFRKPVLSPTPVVKDSAWPKSEIDRFVLAKLESKQLHPTPDADRETLVRRVYFDLIGIPPTPDQIDAFLKDTATDAYSKLIDRLLESPQFGERWGRYWLDVARFGESTGKERNVPYPFAWRYRDYVIEAFNKDKPYDRFIREQVAGDLLQTSSSNERNEALTATGFLAIGTKSLNERNREQFLMDQADEQIDVATRVVLGMTVACARCHDHKFDPISQSDYYAVAGIFRSTEVLSGVQAGNNKSGYEGQFGSMASGEIKPKQSPEQMAEIERLTTELKEVRSRRQQISSVKPAKLKGKAAKKITGAAERMDNRIAALEQQIKVAKGQEAPGSGEPVMTVRDSSKPANCRINIRGEVRDLGDEVPRGVPVVLAFDRGAKFDTDHSGRTQFAAWLVNRENPLTARVMVNRIWSHLFGRGIVESVDNFGSLGDEPTHLELLDYLAIRFMDLNWSVKKTIKEIMLSRTYQLSSDHQEAAFSVDPDNRLLWRMNRRRLEAEAIRDSILAVAGKLNLERPPGSLVKDNGATEIGRRRGSEMPDYSSFDRRSVYLPIIRGKVPDVLSVFDVADPSLIVGQRDVTTVATQALFMMNSSLVIQQSTEAAKRVLYEAPANDDDRIRYAFRLILGHGPSSAQREQSLAYVREMERLFASTSSTEEKRSAAWASLCQTLIASAEFRYVY